MRGHATLPDPDALHLDSLSAAGDEVVLTAQAAVQWAAAMGLPAYRPGLHPPDGVVQERRRAVVGRVCAPPDEKVAAIETGPVKWKADPARVRSLAGWDWIAAGIPRPAPAQAARSNGIGIRCRHGG